MDWSPAVTLRGECRLLEPLLPPWGTALLPCMSGAQCGGLVGPGCRVVLYSLLVVIGQTRGQNLTVFALIPD